MKKPSPLVSVVTCTYNRAHLIAETIQSVLSQTWQDLEYIVVDDGSTDNTQQIISSFKDPRIQYFFHKRTGGHLSKLRNFAHQQCKGEFIAYVDSDDLWKPTKLEIQVKGLIEQPAAGFSFSDIETFDQNGIIRKSLYNQPTGTYTGSVFPEMLDNRLIICHTTLVVKMSSLKKVGPMDETMHSGDHDTVFFLSRNFDAFVVYQQLVRVRKHEGNSTASPELNLRLLREHHQTLKKLFHKGFINAKQYDKAVAITSYSFGHQLLTANDPRSAYLYFLKSWFLRPWHIKSSLLATYALAKKVLG